MADKVVAILGATGVVGSSRPELLPDAGLLEHFKSLLREWWRTTLDLVAEAKHGKPFFAI